MNKSQLINLFKVNLLYINPQATEQSRKKGKTGNKIYRSILSQYAFMSVIFTVIYGGIMFALDFSKYPGYFTFYIALFLVMTFAQGVSIIYNIFYNSKDLKDYLPLPFLQRDVFLAKFLIIGLTLAPFMLPILVLFVLTAIRASQSLLVGLPLSLILFLLFFYLGCGISTLIVTGLTQTQVFIKHKSIMTTLLMFIPMLGMMAGIMYLNQKQADAFQGTLVDQTIIYPFLPFHTVLTNLFSINGLISLLVIMAACLALAYLLKRVVISSFYRLASEETNHSTVKSKKAKQVKKRNFEGLPKQLFRYNLSLIKDPTLLLQVLTSLIMPVIIIFPTLMIGELELGTIPLEFWLIPFLIGLFLALFTVNSTSIISLIISLDRENFYFVRSLPINMKDYLKAKFTFAFTIQATLTGLVTLIVGLIGRVPILLIIFAILGCVYGCFVAGMYYFYRDFRLLSLNWTSVSQLFTRGGGNFMMVLSIFGTIIIGLSVIGGTVFLLFTTGGSLLVSLAILLVILGIGGILFAHYQRIFWRNLE
ncbi:hypothetical protein BAU15_03675 [Enterococcus sp. JM4C]|uniref:ABC transporter n=1 Tax=Candidatus Enterococcus huntleyi TaxID=1857217 RepID=UPI00137A6444|nr:ABC transporter [Enterococcus sp. JM4C]KAF1295651.1 hypothetical protein BAU15_03675 [Enterococcus sp. JM4C]